MPYADPEKRKAYHREYEKRRREDPVLRQKQRDACNRYMRKKYHEDPEYRKRRNRLRVVRRYGITLDDYEAMLTAQNGKCAICQEVEHVEENGKRLHIDHCHETGKVRGLLCTNCNSGFVHKHATPQTLRRAADYLENPNGIPTEKTS